MSFHTGTRATTDDPTELRLQGLSELLGTALVCRYVTRGPANARVWGWLIESIGSFYTSDGDNMYTEREKRLNDDAGWGDTIGEAIDQLVAAKLHRLKYSAEYWAAQTQAKEAEYTKWLQAVEAAK